MYRHCCSVLFKSSLNKQSLHSAKSNCGTLLDIGVSDQAGVRVSACSGCNVLFVKCSVKHLHIFFKGSRFLLLQLDSVLHLSFAISASPADFQAFDELES